MMLINPLAAPVIGFTRPTETPYGEVSFTTLGDTPAVVSISNPSIAGADGPGSTQAGVVFTPRGLDRKEGDRFPFGGHTYELVGNTRGDQDHPLTGADFGWVSHAVKRVG